MNLSREYLTGFGTTSNTISIRLPEESDIFLSTFIENYSDVDRIIGMSVYLENKSNMLLGKVVRVNNGRIIDIEIENSNKWILDYNRPILFGFDYSSDDILNKGYNTLLQSFKYSIKNAMITSLYLRKETVNSSLAEVYSRKLNNV